MTKNRVMRAKLLPLLAIIAIVATTSCKEQESNIGSSLIDDSIAIHVDSNFTITGKSVRMEDTDTRSNTFLLGKVKIPGYGTLESSFVAQMMSSIKMDIPDTIPVDSVSAIKMIVHYNRRTITGDSLSPNRLTAYQLNKQLPADIKSNFNPAGYYDTDPLGSISYTSSALGSKDSSFLKDTYGHLRFDLPKSLGKKFFTQYRKDPSVFQWPSTFKEYFPGIYIDNTFGSGSLINVVSVEMPLYYTLGVRKMAVVDSVAQYVWVSQTDSVTLFATAPEVLGSTNFHYEMDESVAKYINDDEVISVAPCGYIAEITLPLADVIDRYMEAKSNLSMINNLILTIPGEKLATDYNLSVPSNLLLVRKADYDSFFTNNQMPDNENKTFWASYNSSKGVYTFTSMRQFIIDLVEAGGTPEAEDCIFYLVPVDITTELSSMNSDTYVTSCTPYVAQPTLVRYNMKGAQLKLTFSVQAD